MAAVALLCACGAAAQNLTGRITCQGKGVAGVAVSDGVEVVQTDEEGYYKMQSSKQLGLVFYTLPGGYEPEMKDGFRPQFWATLSSADSTVNEVHDFALRKVKNEKFRMAIGTDSHLANRADDVKQFRNMFVGSLKREVKEARKTPIYSLLLGDLTWDRYWAKNHFGLNTFVETCKEAKYPMPLWAVMGNHDNDPSIPYTTEAETDLLATGKWRSVLGPAFYSFHLGKVHFVVLDDITYRNETKGKTKFAEGVVGSRNYREYINHMQFSWLLKDLALCDSLMPLVVALHAPVLETEFHNPARSKDHLDMGVGKWLLDIVKKFEKVYVVSGHKHINSNKVSTFYPHIREFTINSLCGIMWDSYASSGRHNCMDGTPGGYYLWEFDGDKAHWEFKSMESKDCNQFRIYDMNTVRQFYAQDPTIRAMLKKYPEREDFATTRDNIIMVNVYAYENDWKVEILEDGTPLNVHRHYKEDPFHVLCHDIVAFKEKGSIIFDRAGKKNWHMFRARATTANKPVTVRVTDSFGKVYQRTIQRPHPYSLDMEQLEK